MERSPSGIGGAKVIYVGLIAVAVVLVLIGGTLLHFHRGEHGGEKRVD